jgi:DNA adenine methylase
MAMKTFIKWFGNKSRCKKHLVSNFPINYKTYIEPFLGSGAVFLEVKPVKWIINDVNVDLIHLWVYIKESLPPIVKIINSFSKAFLPLERVAKINLCKTKTTKLITMNQGPTRSAYFLLMKHCVFLGLLLSKTNQYYFRGLEQNFNDNNYIPVFAKDAYKENLKQISKHLNETKGKILNTDYKNVLRLAKSGDFVFMDPPYKEDRDYDFIYNAHENLTNAFITELKEECVKLDKRNVMWLMTQTDTQFIRKLFSKYTISEMKVYRRGRNAYVTELIIINYAS